MKTITSEVIACLHPYGVNANELHNLRSAAQLAYIDNEESLPSKWVKVGKATITIEFFDTDVVVQDKLEILNKQLAEARAEAQEKINFIQDQINNLTAIAYEVQA